MSSESDINLVESILAGDSSAYAELIRRHHARVQGLCLSVLRAPSEAEDAAQDVFIKAYRALPKFRKDSSFSSWLYRIASNHCLDLLRRQAREKLDSLDSLTEGDDAHQFPDLAPDFGASAETADLVERALNVLPPQYRIILDLREVQGLNYEELTETLECSLDAVKSRLARARRSFAQIVRHLLRTTSVSTDGAP